MTLTSQVGNSGGFVFLKSLFFMAAVLIAAAAVCAALAAVIKQTSFLTERMKAEETYRIEAVEDRL